MARNCRFSGLTRAEAGISVNSLSQNSKSIALVLAAAAKASKPKPTSSLSFLFFLFNQTQIQDSLTHQLRHHPHLWFRLVWSMIAYCSFFRATAWPPIRYHPLLVLRPSKPREMGAGGLNSVIFAAQARYLAQVYFFSMDLRLHV